MVNLPEPPVATLIVTQRSIVELACVDSTALVMERYWLVQPGRPHVHIHAAHCCGVLPVLCTATT